MLSVNEGFRPRLRRRELNREFTALSQLTDLTFENVFHWCLLRNSTWEPSEAVGTLIGYVAADPGDRPSRLALAENYLRMDHVDDAESILTQSPDSDSEALELRIRIALERQDFEKADRLVASAAPNDPLIARLRGRMALARGDVPSAAPRLSHCVCP